MGCTSIEFLQVVVNHLAYCISNAECRYLAEVHALDSFAAQGRANWRTRTCLARSYDQLDDLISCRHFSRHLDKFEDGDHNLNVCRKRKSLEPSNIVTEAVKGQIRGRAMTESPKSVVGLEKG
jgi:hypothetical protein